MKETFGVSIKWLAVSCFEIQCGNTTVVTDPYITECRGTELDWEAVEKCEIICVGHSHWDHITDIPRLYQKFHPIVLCGEQTAMPMAKWLNCNPTFMYPMYPDMELDFGDVKIRALYGRHSNLGYNFQDLSAWLAEDENCRRDPGIAALQDIGSMEYRNYLFTLPNGTKILFWGNDPTPEQIKMCSLLAPDIAIIQRGKTPEEIVRKAEFAAAIGCKVVIPHHHDFRRVDESWVTENLKKEYLCRVPDGIFVIPEHGKWIRF